MMGIITNSFKFIIVLSLLTACDEAAKVLEQVAGYDNDGVSDYVDVDGSEATSFLSPSYKKSSLDVDSTLEAMGVAQDEKAKASLRMAGLISVAEENKISEVSTSTLSLMGGVQSARKSFDDESFERDANDFFTKTATKKMFERTRSFSSDTVTWSHSDSKFTVSMLSKMPVKNQGRRPTCSSFAGIAQIEAYLIKRYELDGIDLSEQRFYYMSKPDHWSDGGDVSSGGSNAGTGFAKSAGTSFDGHTFPPDSPSDYNIPLETSCPYNDQKGDNDLQVPQVSGCKSGVAKVQSYSAWINNASSRPNTAQEIYDVLVNDDLPVVVASKLSDNWEYNDGIITSADAGDPGQTSHASGHAYLVVGAMKLDEASFPNEGGMCFIIRNSWGRGWGVNGLSCMTLAWFNNWRYDTGFPIVSQVDLDTTTVESEIDNLDTLPDNLEDPDDSTKTKTRRKLRTRGEISFFTENPLKLQNSDKTLGALKDNENRYSKVLYYTENDVLYMQGILDGDNKLTHPLSFVFSSVDNSLQYEFEKRGKLTVGKLDSDSKILSVCSENYGSICRINYDEETNELLIGLTKEEYDKDVSQGPFNWTSFNLPGDDIQVSKPSGLNTKVDVRYLVEGTPTNPLRFAVSPTDGGINYQDKKVGSIGDASFCNGDYKEKCRSVKASDAFDVHLKAGEVR